MRRFTTFALVALLGAGCSGNGPTKEDAGNGTTDAGADQSGAESTFHVRSTFELELEPRAPIPADVDGDGNVDLVIAHQFSSNVAVLRGNTLGDFTPFGPVEAERATGSAVADFDGDEQLDLVLAVEGEPRLTVISDLTSEAISTDLELTAIPDSVIATDIDGDGDRDIAASVAGTGSEPATRVALFENADAIFSASAPVEVGFQPRGLVVGDVDDDGDEDLGVVLGTTSALILEADGNGSFAASGPFDAGEGVLGATFVDVDESGTVDMVFADLTGDALTVALDVPDRDAEELYATMSPFDVVTAKLNDDERPDLIFSRVDDGSVRGLMSTPEGTYRPVLIATVSDAVRLGGLAAADFDGDGIDDVAVVERGRDSEPGTLHIFTSSPAPTR